jgi:NADP-dependent 3-hydroxy acid dehydrogenase YdfG
MTAHERPVAVVTGAGCGLGRAQAAVLAARGFDVIVNERSSRDGTAVALATVEAAGA